MSKPPTSPIFEADISKLMNPSKLMGEFKMPGINMNGLMEMQRKNVEMITTINQAVIENWQSFAQHQAEFMQHVFEGASSMMNTIMSATTSQEKIMRQAETPKSVAEKYTANVHDTTEMLAKRNSHAVETASNGLEDPRSASRTSRATQGNVSAT